LPRKHPGSFAVWDLPPDRVELIPPVSIPKTSSGKLRREETRTLPGLNAQREEIPQHGSIARLGKSGTLKEYISRHAGRSCDAFLEVLYGCVFAVLFMVLDSSAWIGVLFFRDHRAAGRSHRQRELLFFLAGIRVRVVGKEFMSAHLVRRFTFRTIPAISTCSHCSAGPRRTYRVSLCQRRRHKMPGYWHVPPQNGPSLRSYAPMPTLARRRAQNRIQRARWRFRFLFVPEHSPSTEGARRVGVCFQLGAFRPAVSRMKKKKKIKQTDEGKGGGKKGGG